MEESIFKSEASRKAFFAKLRKSMLAYPKGKYPASSFLSAKGKGKIEFLGHEKYGPHGGPVVNAGTVNVVKGQENRLVRLLRKAKAIKEARETIPPPVHDKDRMKELVAKSGKMIKGTSIRYREDVFTRKGDKIVDSSGKAVPSSKLKHISALRIPPAWSNVKIDPNPNAKLLVMGQDSKGRWQPIYSKKNMGESSANKFSRSKSFSRVLPSIRASIESGIEKPSSKLGQISTILGILEETGIRIGSTDEGLGKVPTYGASTLKKRHVSFSGKSATLKFVGKKGIQNSVQVKNPKLVQSLKELSRGKTDFDDLFPTVSAKDVSWHLKKISGGDFSPKDFRTHLGSKVAFEFLNSRLRKTKVLSAASAKKLVRDTSAAVALVLHNTPSVAKSSYINPAVWTPLIERGFQP